MPNLFLKLCAALRVLRTVLHLFYGLLLVRVVFPFCSVKQQQGLVQHWGRGLLRAVGMALQVAGAPPKTGPMLLVSNHVSWLDVAALHAGSYCRFVSKAEVKAWPVFGQIAQRIHTLFIERGSRRDAVRMVADMTQALQRGSVVAIFPEGTTSTGLQILPFHANLLQAAIEAQCAVQPVAISYLNAADMSRSIAPSFTGDETLLFSLWRTVQTKGLLVRVEFGCPMAVQGEITTRKDLAITLQQALEQLIACPHPTR
jgi:1-acyl-sn-glycerol-3-phosphate acyltransferase